MEALIYFSVEFTEEISDFLRGGSPQGVAESVLSVAEINNNVE